MIKVVVHARRPVGNRKLSSHKTKLVVVNSAKSFKNIGYSRASI